MLNTHVGMAYVLQYSVTSVLPSGQVSPSIFGYSCLPRPGRKRLPYRSHTQHPSIPCRPHEKIGNLNGVDLPLCRVKVSVVWVNTPSRDTAPSQTRVSPTSSSTATSSGDTSCKDYPLAWPRLWHKHHSHVRWPAVARWLRHHQKGPCRDR